MTLFIDSSLLISSLGVLIIIFAVGVITNDNPVFSVCYLILVFVSVSAYLALCGVFYLSLTYLIIYIGAIAILLLFVIIIINLKLVEMVEKGLNYTKHIPLGVLIVTFLLYFMSLFMGLDTQIPLNGNTDLSFSDLNEAFGEITYRIANIQVDSLITSNTDINTIGTFIYSEYIVWVIIIGLIMLLCIIGPIVLSINTVQS